MFTVMRICLCINYTISLWLAENITLTQRSKKTGHKLANNEHRKVQGACLPDSVRDLLFKLTNITGNHLPTYTMFVNVRAVALARGRGTCLFESV